MLLEISPSTWSTVFDAHGIERLNEWKRFRDKLETSSDPLKDLAEFWSRAPFVSSYLDENNPKEWPDPWHLVLDERLDDLAIALGMLYTLKLTQRFMDSQCEIHMSMLPNKDPCHFLLVDNKYILNYKYREVVDIEELKDVTTSKLYPSSSKK